MNRTGRTPIVPSNIESLKKELFKNVMEGDWEKVAEIYRNEPAVPKPKIKKLGHTALHLAVSDSDVGIVEKMVKAIQENGSKEALGIENDRGNTALHFAAAIGNVLMCKCIASADPSLIGKRNEKGETPLFTAVLFRQKKAFWCLQELSLPQEVYSYFTRAEDGQNILHCAISTEDFELAIQIMHKYEGLVNLFDTDGNTPLHTLASKPSCFRSGANFRRWENILYNCIYVNKPKIVPHTNGTTLKEEGNGDGRPKINSAAFIDFSLCWKNTVHEIVKVLGRGKKRTQNVDIEKSADQARTDREKTGAQGAPDIVTSFDKFGTYVCSAFLFIFGYEFSWINKTREQKERHLLAVQVVSELLKRSSIYDDIDNNDPGKDPGTGSDEYHREITSVINEVNVRDVVCQLELQDLLSDFEDLNSSGDQKEVKCLALQKKETAILVAAKNGVAEIVDQILNKFPVAIYDADSNRKNILLLAAENRHLEVYKRILKKKNLSNNFVIYKVDDQRNTALHLAAMHKNSNKLWPIPGAALQMQSEIKWYKFVERSMPPNFFVLPNIDSKTPEEIFTESHEKMAKAGSKWLTGTSTACSVVNTIIATVVFTSCTTFPGGNDEKNHGKPTLQNESTFNRFMDSSMVSLFSAVTSLVVFLAILTSRHQQQDFGTDLPRKLLLGLTSLFVSIAAMLASFCSGHLSAREDKLKNAMVLLYALAFLPSSLFAISQLPLYIDLARATFWNPF